MGLRLPFTEAPRGKEQASRFNILITESHTAPRLRLRSYPFCSPPPAFFCSVPRTSPHAELPAPATVLAGALFVNEPKTPPATAHPSACATARRERARGNTPPESGHVMAQVAAELWLHALYLAALWALDPRLAKLELCRLACRELLLPVQHG